MVVLAREYRGYSQKELADSLGITAGYLSKIELEVVPCTVEIAKNCAAILKLPVDFFTARESILPSMSYYRKRAKTTKSSLLQANAEMNISRFGIERLLRSIELNVHSVPSCDLETYNTAKDVAKFLRELWKVPRGPIRDLYQLIEGQGIIIVECTFTTQEIDGRIMEATDGHQIIFLNKSFPMDRKRFTVAHELGHIIMHHFTNPSLDRDTEKEANDFASEFLIPAEELERTVSGKITMDKLANLKRFYRVSMQAALVKLHKESKVSTSQFRRLWTEFGRLNIKKREPAELDPPKESAILFKRMIELYQDHLTYSDQEMESVLLLLRDEWKEKHFGHSPTIRLML